MKTLKFLSTFIVLSLTILSCKKETSLVEQNEKGSNQINYTFKNGRVAFQDVSSYDNLGFMSDSALQFQYLSKIKSSLARTNQTAYNSLRTVEDELYNDSIRTTIEFLDAILNEDEIFEIEGKIVKLDFEEEKVYLLDTSYDNSMNYEKLVNGEADGTTIKEYSMSSDVTTIIEEGDTGAFLCGESGITNKHDFRESSPYLYGYCGNNYTLTIDIVYKNYGVYFNIITTANTKGIERTSPLVTDAWGKIEYLRYKPKCRSEYGPSSYSFALTTTTGGTCGSGVGSGRSTTSYSSTRGLNKVWVKAKTYINFSGIYRESPMAEIRVNY